MNKNSTYMYCPNASNIPYTLSIEWSETSTSIVNNTSTISVKTSISASNVGFSEGNSCPLSIEWYDAKNKTVKIKSVDVHKVGYGSGGPSTVTVSGSIVVEHNQDGKLSGKAIARFVKHAWASGWVPTTTSVEVSGSLTDIARASTISSLSSNGLLGGSVTVNIQKKADAYRHSVEYRFETNEWVSVGSGIDTSKTFEVPLSNATKIPNSTVGNLTVRIKTFNRNAQIGESNEKTISLKVPDSVKPTMSAPTATRVDNGVPPSWNEYVQSFSKVSIKMNNVTGVLGSTIKSYSIVGPNLSSSKSSDTSSVLNASGTCTYTCVAIDSRGRQVTASVSIVVQPYFLPSISIKALRCRSNGVVATDGTSLLITPAYSCASINRKNSVTKKSISCNSVSNTTFASDVAFQLNANCSIENTYQVTASVTDALGKTITTSVDIPTSFRILNVRSTERGIAFGGFCKSDNMEVKMDAIFEKGIYYHDGQRLTDTRKDNQLPMWYLKKIGNGGGVASAGSVKEFKETSAIGLPYIQYNTYCTLETVLPYSDKSGGRVRQIAYCNGTERMFTRMSDWDWTGWDEWSEIMTDTSVVDTVYPVGSIYISVNNVNPKNLFGGTWERFANGRTLVGVDESDADFNKSLKTGGEKKHTLTVDEMPSHHHGFKQYNLDGTEEQWSAQSSASIKVKESQSLITNTGGGQSHNNLQPFISVYMWKRTA